MAGSFTFGTTNLADYGVTILEGAPTSRDLIPQIREHIVEIPGRDGFYDYDPEYGPRYFRLRCICEGSSHTDLESKLDSLESIFDVKAGTKKLKFDTKPTKYWNARVAGVTPVEIYPLYAEFTITFVAPDPATQTEE